MKLNYFRFKPFGNQVLLTNDIGKHIFLRKDEFKALLQKKIDLASGLGMRLNETGMIYDDTDLEFSERFMYDLRVAKGYLNTPTTLHIFVLTTACNMNCVYCQANSGEDHKPKYMSKETAEKAVEIALQSPTDNMSFEFQGGEPLLNFDVMKHIVKFAEEHCGHKEIHYNVVSNLTLLTDEMVEFFAEHSIAVSTSVDGPELLHNLNRPFANMDGSFRKTLAGIEKLKAVGIRPGAIQTTTRYSLKYPKEIVDCYLELGFDSIFLRPLTPLGKALKSWEKIGYTPQEFLSFYKTAFDHLLWENKQGKYMREEHSTILLNKMDGRFVNYMELRSPCGAGIGQLAYYADGNIFTCDEARMLYEMGQEEFCLANVEKAVYTDVVNNSKCRATCSSSILETIPSCCDCVYQPYCGTCPVVNYAIDGDIIEKHPQSYRCQIYSGILDFLFSLIQENNEETMKVLDSWKN